MRCYQAARGDSPVSRPKCTTSSRRPSPTWWPLWCRWAPARRSVPSSCWAESSPPCGVWHRSGWPWPAWAWWSLWLHAGARSLKGWDMRGSAMCWSCWPRTSLGWCSLCSPPAGRVRWRHTRSFHLESWEEFCKSGFKSIYTWGTKWWKSTSHIAIHSPQRNDKGLPLPS